MKYFPLIKKSLIVASLLVAVPFIQSCKDKVEETTEVQAMPNTVDQNKAALQNAAPASGTTAEGMNPPHGQPNHRCDIAVGAPLNGSASTTTENSAAPVQMNSATSSGALNPAHGEAGHRCDIQVGAPLPNS